MDPRDQIAALRDLRDRPGWKLLCKWMDDQRVFLLQRIATPIGDVNAVYAQEKLKGEYEALSRLVDAPEILMQELRRDLEDEDGSGED